MRVFLRGFVVGLVVLLLFVVPVFGVFGGSSFLVLVNSSRVGAGLLPVVVDGGLSGVALGHSVEMEAGGVVFHSSGLGGVVSGGWEAVAEVVGAGPSVDSVFAAFLASAGHRAIVLGDFDSVGVGVVVSDSGQVWVTLIFVRRGVPVVSVPVSTVSPVVVVPSSLPSSLPAPTTSTLVFVVPGRVVVGLFTGSAGCRDAGGFALWVSSGVVGWALFWPIAD